jgi:hypothetical protein
MRPRLEQKYFSVKLKPKEAKREEKKATTDFRAELNDEIPF